MKKILIIILIVIGVVLLSEKDSNVIIPKEAIRFRIIANSNSKLDQENKLKLRDKIQKKLTADLKNKNINEARIILNNNLETYSNIVEETLPDTKYKITYGNNYFPEKIYKGVEYEKGNYESLVIKLGEAKGDNWWCVLFPPLCLLEGEEEEKEEVEYKSYILELIDKYL